MLHTAVVVCSSALYGGLNLYNNGFSAGLVAIVLVAALERFIKLRLKKNEITNNKRKDADLRGTELHMTHEEKKTA